MRPSIGFFKTISCMYKSFRIVDIFNKSRLLRLRHCKQNGSESIKGPQKLMTDSAHSTDGHFVTDSVKQSNPGNSKCGPTPLELSNDNIGSIWRPSTPQLRLIGRSICRCSGGVLVHRRNSERLFQSKQSRWHPDVWRPGPGAAFVVSGVDEEQQASIDSKLTFQTAEKCRIPTSCRLQIGKKNSLWVSRDRSLCSYPWPDNSCVFKFSRQKWMQLGKDLNWTFGVQPWPNSGKKLSYVCAKKRFSRAGIGLSFRQLSCIASPFSPLHFLCCNFHAVS